MLSSAVATGDTLQRTDLCFRSMPFPNLLEHLVYKESFETDTDIPLELSDLMPEEAYKGNFLRSKIRVVQPYIDPPPNSPPRIPPPRLILDILIIGADVESK